MENQNKMNEKLNLNILINKAFEVAAKAHKHQFRKVTDIPYIVHPFEVAMILHENGMSEEIIAGGILHDILEDTKVTKEYIEKTFGKRILNLVLGASEVLEGRNKRPWKERKGHTIEYIKNAPKEVKFIACADKLSNIRSMIRDYMSVREKLWERFNAPYEEQKWYYESLVESLKDLEGYKMYEEFKEAVRYLFGK